SWLLSSDRALEAPWLSPPSLCLRRHRCPGEAPGEMVLVEPRPRRMAPAAVAEHRAHPGTLEPAQQDLGLLVVALAQGSCRVTLAGPGQGERARRGQRIGVVG